MNENMNTAAGTAEAVETVESAAIAAAGEEARAFAPEAVETAEAEATETAETDIPDDGDAEQEPEERVLDERDTLIAAEPLKEVKDRNGNAWFRLFCDRKTVMVKEAQIAAITWDEEATEPLVHLKDAKDVLRINPASWRALNAALFGEYVY